MKNKVTYEIIAGTTHIDNVESYIQQIQHFSKTHSTPIQIFNADMVCGVNHLQSAITHAIRAQNEQRMSTQSIEMEILLYASGERQLTHAIPKMGIHPGHSSVALIFLQPNSDTKDLPAIITKFLQQFSITKNPSVLHVTKDKLQRWGFSNTILTPISSKEYDQLILEKIAMVDIIK